MSDMRPPKIEVDANGDITVTRCVDCPFEYDSYRCRHPDARDGVSPDEVRPDKNSDGSPNDEYVSRPDNCPLDYARSGPITIRVRAFKT